MEGAKTNRLVVPATENRNGNHYRCTITDVYGNSIISLPGKLNIDSSIEQTIYTNPLIIRGWAKSEEDANTQSVFTLTLENFTTDKYTISWQY
jgi:hypothetical protein